MEAFFIYLCIMIIAIIISWGVLGVLAHYKFRELAIKEGVLQDVDPLGILLAYGLAPWWFFWMIVKNVIIEEWD